MVYRKRKLSSKRQVRKYVRSNKKSRKNTRQNKITRKKNRRYRKKSLRGGTGRNYPPTPPIQNFRNNTFLFPPPAPPGPGVYAGGRGAGSP